MHVTKCERIDLLGQPWAWVKESCFINVQRPQGLTIYTGILGLVFIHIRNNKFHLSTTVICMEVNFFIYFFLNVKNYVLDNKKKN